MAMVANCVSYTRIPNLIAFNGLFIDIRTPSPFVEQVCPRVVRERNFSLDNLVQVSYTVLHRVAANRDEFYLFFFTRKDYGFF